MYHTSALREAGLCYFGGKGETDMGNKETEPVVIAVITRDRDLEE